MNLNTSLPIKNYSIQALRAIAALFVVLDHTITQFNIYHPISGYLGNVLLNVQGVGTVGVYVFFIVSGYIMSFTTFKKEWNLNESWLFLKKRFIRIYPLYWIWLSLLVIAWALGLVLKQHDYSINKIIASYLLLPYSDGAPYKINPVLGQGWTLIFEMFYYLFFSLLILTDVKKKNTIIISLLFFIFINLLGELSVGGLPYLNFFMSSKLFYLFVLGMVVFRFESLLVRVLKNRMCLLFVFFGFLSSLTFLVFIGLSLEHKKICMAFLAIFLFAILFVKAADFKLLSVLGDASYSLYLSHGFVVMTYGVLCKSFTLPYWVLFLAGVVTIFLSVFVGLLGYFLIEKPLQRFLNKKIIPTKVRSL